MKDLVYCILDIDILIKSNTAERSLFTCTIIAIERFCLVRPSTPTESVLLWLAQLSQLVSPYTNGFDCIESKSLLVGLATNSNRIKSKSLLIGPFTNLNCTKSKSLGNNCCKSNDVKSKEVGSKKVERDDSKGSE